MQKQAGGEGVNFASIIAGLGIVLLLGGWLAWVAGVGGKPLPSLRQNMTQTARALPTIDSTVIMGQIKETPFYYGIIPLTPRPAATATPSAADQIGATQTQWWVSNAIPQVLPTATRLPGECAPEMDDACFRQWVDAGLNPEEWWNLWTPQVATAIPTLRTFVTWTPTPDVSTFEREIQATIHMMAQATAQALTPQAEERTRDDFEERGASQAARRSAIP